MCVTCVAEGAMYVGGAGVGLRLMAARAAANTRRLLRDSDTAETRSSDPAGDSDIHKNSTPVITAT